MAALPVDGSPLTPLAAGTGVPPIATLSTSSTIAALPSPEVNATSVLGGTAVSPSSIPSPSPVAAGDSIGDATITLTTTHTAKGQPAGPPTGAAPDGAVGNDLLNTFTLVNSTAVITSNTALSTPTGTTILPSDVLLNNSPTPSGTNTTRLPMNTAIGDKGAEKTTTISSTTSPKPAAYTDSPFRINPTQNDTLSLISSSGTTSPSLTSTTGTSTTRPTAPTPLVPTPSSSNTTSSPPVTLIQPVPSSDVALQPSPDIVPQTTFVTAGVTLTGSEAIAVASAAASGESGPAGHVVQTDSTGLGTGAIIGIICGAVGLIIVLVGLCCFISKRKLNKARNEVSDEEIEKNLDDDEDFYAGNRNANSGFDFIDVPITPKGGNKRSRRGRGRGRDDRQDPFDDRHSQFSRHGPARPDSGIVDPDPYYPTAHHDDPFTHPSDDAHLEEALHEEYRSIHGQQHWQTTNPFSDHRAEAWPSHNYAPTPPPASYAGPQASTSSPQREPSGRDGAGSIPPSGNYNSIYGAYVSSRPGTTYDPSDNFQRPPETAATAALLPWLRDGPAMAMPSPSGESVDDAPAPAALPLPSKKSKKKWKKRQAASPQRAPSPDNTYAEETGFAPAHEAPDRAAPRPMMAQTPAYSGAGGWQGVIPNFR